MSLGMSFARRRMMAAAKREPKYVWAVYSVSYYIDDNSTVIGNATLSITRFRMWSYTYIINGSGFILTNASEGIPSVSIPEKAYIVDVSKIGGEKISGEYLYEITGFGPELPGDVAETYYVRYSSSQKKGDTELYRVESDTLDYPTNGEQDGLWYVLVEGEV